MIIGESIAKLLDKQLETNYEAPVRNYVGASMIGNRCPRAIWYSYKGYQPKTLTAKQRRMFEIGKNLELMIKEELINAGFYVIYNHHQLSSNDKDILDFKGTADLIIQLKTGEKIIIEIKTAKDSNFNKFKKQGLNEWRPDYYMQIQAYMGMLNIQHAYILVINKDSSEIGDEFIYYDKHVYESLKRKAAFVIESKEPPEKINKNPMFYLCSLCQYKELCHAE